MFEGLLTEPQRYADTQDGVIRQLVLMAEFALAEVAEDEDELNISDALEEQLEAHMESPQKAPTVEWSKLATYIALSYIAARHKNYYEKVDNEIEEHIQEDLIDPHQAYSDEEDHTCEPMERMVNEFAAMRLDHMLHNPQTFGHVKDTFFWNLVMIAEFSMLGIEVRNSDKKGVYRNIAAVVPEISTREQMLAPVTKEWAEKAVHGVEGFLTEQFRFQQGYHDNTCEHCNPPADRKN